MILRLRRSLTLQFLSVFLTMALVVTGTLRVAVAETLSIEDVVTQNTANDARATVLSYLDRDDVRREFLNRGVPADEVRARFAALSDDEAVQLAKTIHDAPAGGDGVGIVVSAILIVFLVLLFTDILGLTKVFPFTRSVRR